MSKPKPHPKSPSKSKSNAAVRRSGQQGLPPRPKPTGASPVKNRASDEIKPSSAVVAREEKPAPVFSQANKSLEELARESGASHSARPMSEEVSAPSMAANFVVVPHETPLQEAPVDITTEAARSVSARSTEGVLPSQIVREAQGHRGATSGGAKGGRVSARRWNRGAIWIGASLGLGMLVASGAAGAYSNFASSEIIAPNVSIGGVAVGGLTQAQAKERIAAHVGAPKITLKCDDRTITMPVSQLGARVDVLPTVRHAYAIGRAGSLQTKLLSVYNAQSDEKRLSLPIKWDDATLRSALEKLGSQIEVAPTNARLISNADGLEVVPDTPGRALDQSAAAHVIKRSWRLGVSSIALPMRTLDAKVPARSLAGHDVQLAMYPTHFNPGIAGRTENIRIACRAIQNHVLMPGQTFSFNACTGERTARKGYQMAHIFMRQPGEDDPEVVEGLAGGVCQVSSTLFNAVRKTNDAADMNPLKIVERNTHSLPVTYVPPGLDATVAWPGKDFKFRNISPNPVYIHTQMGRSKLSISIWSRIPNS